MRKICMSGSMSGVWKRSQGRTSKAPPDERGGNRYVRPTATAPHSDSTHFSPLPLRAMSDRLGVGCGLSTRDIRGSQRLSKLLDFRPEIAVANILIYGAPVETGKE